MKAIGLDIGGANLKISDGTTSGSAPFPLWRMPEMLPSALADLLRSYDAEAPLAVTMTGELADCFTTRAEGVGRILDAVIECAGGRSIAVWQTSGEFVTPDVAREFPTLTAAANWHALATWAGRMFPQGNVLLVDIGSTTTDIIPIEQGLPLPAGRTDLERLVSSELAYLGVRRTPVCSIADEVHLQGRTVPLARELFATTLDVGLLTGRIPERPDLIDTANGRPATADAAWDRLARMLCSDRDVIPLADIRSVAEELLAIMVNLTKERIRNVLRRGNLQLDGWLLAGEGEWLAAAACDSFVDAKIPKVSLTALLGEAHSEAACAFALARMLAEAAENLP